MISIAAATLLALCGTFLCISRSAHASPSVGTFLTDTAVSKPSVISPADGSHYLLPNQALAFHWNPIGGATNYQVQVARIVGSESTCNFTSDIVLDVPAAQAAYTPTMASGSNDAKLGSPGTYCWRVRAVDGGSGGTWSPVTSYSVAVTGTDTGLAGLAFYNNTHAMPVPLGTPSDSTTSLNGYLSWNPVPGAEGYDVEVSAASKDFSDDNLTLTSTAGASHTFFVPHLADDTYAWRVRVDSNGTVGAWTYGPQFTVRWATMDNAAGHYTPAQNAVTHDLTLGWEPVPGASYYQVQLATSPGCFWNPESAAPAAYASWVDYSLPAYTPTFCRVSQANFTTVNNYATMDDVVDNKVWTEMVANPSIAFPGYSVNSTGNPNYPTHLYWRVRPVSQISQDTETDFTVAQTFDVYGAWMQYDNGGTSQPFSFQIDHTPPVLTVGTRCPNTAFSSLGSGCVVQNPTSMDPVSMAPNSTSMQTPLFSWQNYFTGASGSPVQAYRLEIARDSDFTHIAVDRVVDNLGTSWQSSYALSDSLPDNSAGDSGYWWRVIPCVDTVVDETTGLPTPCAGVYDDSSAGLEGSIDAAGARSFTKQVTMSTSQSKNFADISPLLQWTSVIGADHYEVQIAQNQAFTGSSVLDEKTTSDGLVPSKSNDSGDGSDNGNSTELAQGTWYWRVRAVDINGVTSGWTAAKSFAVQLPTPSLVSPANGAATTYANLAWNGISGIGEYEVQVSTSSAFTSSQIDATTNQTSYLAANSDGSPLAGGTWYWRVRSIRDGQRGLAWSAVRSFSTPGVGTISYILPAHGVNVGKKITIGSLLSLNGKAADGQKLQVFQKTGPCTVPGVYKSVGTITTGSQKGVDPGQILVHFKADKVHCYRVRWFDLGVSRFSAPFQSVVRPVMKVRGVPKKVRRGKRIVFTVHLNRKISGRIRVLYLHDKKWYPAAGGKLVRKRSVSVRINTKKVQAGKVRMKVVVDRMGNLSPTVKTLRWIHTYDLFRRNSTSKHHKK